MWLWHTVLCVWHTVLCVWHKALRLYRDVRWRWLVLRASLAPDFDGVPHIMLLNAALGDTVGVLALRASGIPWNGRVFRTAARNGHRRTIMWMQLFGCPWELSDAVDCTDTSCLRWLLQFRLQFRQEDMAVSRAVVSASIMGNVPALMLLLAVGELAPNHSQCRWHVSQPRHAYFSSEEHYACQALLVRAGVVPYDLSEGHWVESAARLRMLDGLPGAAGRFHARRRAARTIQRWWTAQYYTPGAPVWRRRMLREFGWLASQL